MNLLSIFWPFICGIANRIRGGWLMNFIKKYIPFWATTTARIFVSFIISVPVWLTSDWNEALLFWIVLYIGFIFRWSPWNFMKNPIEDILCLTLRGWLLTFPAGFVTDLNLFGSSGLLMGITYYLCYKLPLRYEDQDGYVWVGSDWGELFFGFILGFFICLDCIQYM